ncbi:cation:proton antiporter [Nocardioides panacisoli]|uniref:cation:proton antiporter domain-containing protein n=1 Tax=Nocardioides panacisoli TaxID=627624 RepID=UPI001C624D2B|nr:cation:proton antiporter [Nocardioides panacisoli]QYJ04257.1 cation:proton antiporter [Nocardioides panacisoli]
MSAVLVLAVGVAAYALVSQRTARLPITAPMVFVALGALTAALGIVDVPVAGEATSVLIEATLVLVLFSDAVSVDLRTLRRNAWLPLRLLAIGLPLVLGLGWLVATWVLPSLTLVEAALLAALLTPTDAALGQAVVTDRRLPERLREGISVESGLNDGIMVPVVTVLLAFAVRDEEGASAGSAVRLAAEQVGYGVAAGVGFGLLGGHLLHRGSLRREVSGVYRQLGTLAVPVAAYAAAHLAGGNGFIAAFVAGLSFGAMTCAQCRDTADVTTDDGVLLTTIAFFVFGAAFLAPALGKVTPAHLLYVVLSLTVVRMLPVGLALLGTPTTRQTRVFIGWFGPRGLATILFILLLTQELDTAGAEVVATVATVAVGVSVLLHGATAAPWAGHLAAGLAGEGPQPTAARASHRVHRRADRSVDAPHP